MDIREVDGLWCDDITFCPERCGWKSCPRNSRNIRDRTIPHSFSVEIPQDCPKKQEGSVKQMDKETVIKGLECLAQKQEPMANPCSKCDYHDRPNFAFCVVDVATDALALLKQEAVEPHYNARTNWYECGACHYSMTSGMHCRGELIPAYKVGFCAKCGQAVKWE